MGSKLETLHRQIVPGQGMLCILPDQTIFEGTAMHVFSFSIVQQIFFMHLSGSELNSSVTSLGKHLVSFNFFTHTHTNSVRPSKLKRSGRQQINKPLANICPFFNQTILFFQIISPSLLQRLYTDKQSRLEERLKYFESNHLKFTENKFIVSIIIIKSS